MQITSKRITRKFECMGVPMRIVMDVADSSEWYREIEVIGNGKLVVRMYVNVDDEGRIHVYDDAGFITVVRSGSWAELLSRVQSIFQNQASRD